MRGKNGFGLISLPQKVLRREHKERMEKFWAAKTKIISKRSPSRIEDIE